VASDLLFDQMKELVENASTANDGRPVVLWAVSGGPQCAPLSFLHRMDQVTRLLRPPRRRRRAESVVALHTLTHALPAPATGVERPLYLVVRRAVAVVETVLHNINATWCRVTGKPPDRVESDFLSEASTAEAVRESIVMSVRRKNAATAECRLNVGDMVRVRLDWIKAAGLAWSRQVYRVIKVAAPRQTQQQQLLHRHVTYKLVTVHTTKCDDTGDETEVDGVFYRDDLQLYRPVDRCVEGKRQFVVQKLIKPVLQTATQMYEVKWVG
jgi:hypothetical protein